MGIGGGGGGGGGKCFATGFGGISCIGVAVDVVDSFGSTPGSDRLNEVGGSFGNGGGGDDVATSI